MVAAWFGGLGPGLLATALGAICADYQFLSPVGSFTGLVGKGALPLFLFVLQGVLITSLAHALDLARQRAEASALEALGNQEKLAERERELHELVGRLIVAQEEERHRVAYEIHDGFTQMAAAAYRHLALFAERRPQESAQDQQELEDAVALVRRTVEEARFVIANLRPTTLDDFGLATAIRMQIEELQTEGFEASYEDTLGEERLPGPLETAFFRVAQEALTNVRKHAHTQRVRVALGLSDGSVRLEVSDWGRGFTPAEIKQGAGPGERVGLSSMRERIALLGGRLEIRSEPGNGTSVVAEIPLQGTTGTTGEGVEDGKGDRTRRADQPS
jgi:signal transduction histidine kinase